MARGSLLDWLERLHRLGLIRLTPALAEACASIVAMEGVWRSADDLADALASILASDPRTYRAIREHFLRGRIGGDEPPTPRRPPAEPTVRPPLIREGSAARSAPRWLIDSRWSGAAWGVLLAIIVVAGVVGGPTLLEIVCDPILPDEVKIPPEVIAEREESERNAERTKALLAASTEPTTPIAATPKARVDLTAAATVDLIETVTPLEPDPDALPGPIWLRWLVLVLSPLLALLAGRWWAASTQLREDLDRADEEAARARDAAQAGGRALGAIYRISRELWFDAGKVDDAATILARRRHGAPGDDLDVQRTLERTIDAGGRFSPVFAPAERRSIPLVLVDAEKTGHPTLDAVDLVLERWRAGGLIFERYDFDFSPAELDAGAARPSLTLDELARRSEGRPLLIFSRFRLPADYRGALGWPPLLAAWPARAWIDLDPRVLGEHDRAGRELRESLARSIPRFAFTADDLIRAARSVAAGEPLQAAQEAPLPPVEALEEHLWRWAACAALVPDPTWPQLEAVRRELEPLRQALPDPRLVARLIEWAAREGLAVGGKAYLLGGGPRLAFDRARRRRLLEALRAYDDRTGARGEARLEWQARALLIRQLRAANLEGDPYGEALRLAKIGFHTAVMHPAEARRAIAEHTDGAVARELKELALEEMELQAGGAHLAGRWAPAVATGFLLWIRGESATRLGDLFRPRTWSWRAIRWALPGAAIAVVGAGFWWGEEIAGRWDLVPALAEPARGEAVAPRVVTMPATWKAVRLGEGGDEDLTALADVAPMTFVALPGGEFLMGSPETEKDRNEDERQHRVRVSPFAMATHEVTLAQWAAVMKTRPSDCDFGCEDKHPVQKVSWEDACRFAIALTERENQRRSAAGQAALTPCYVPEGESCAWPEANWRCTGFRLPTEAEWEYAARAGTTTAYSFGDDPKDLCKYGNVADESGKKKYPDWTIVPCDDGYADLAPVGSFKANAWELHDMHGNVYEWVWDWLGDYETTSDNDSDKSDKGVSRQVTNDPRGPENGVSRVLRGGSFGNWPWGLRAAFRNWGVPTYRFWYIGFRVVRVPPSTIP